MFAHVTFQVLIVMHWGGKGGKRTAGCRGCPGSSNMIGISCACNVDVITVNSWHEHAAPGAPVHPACLQECGTCKMHRILKTEGCGSLSAPGLLATNTSASAVSILLVLALLLALHPRVQAGLAGRQNAWDQQDHQDSQDPRWWQGCRPGSQDEWHAWDQQDSCDDQDLRGLQVCPLRDCRRIGCQGLAKTVEPSKTCRDASVWRAR